MWNKAFPESFLFFVDLVTTSYQLVALVHWSKKASLKMHLWGLLIFIISWETLAHFVHFHFYVVFPSLLPFRAHIILTLRTPLPLFLFPFSPCRHRVALAQHSCRWDRAVGWYNSERIKPWAVSKFLMRYLLCSTFCVQMRVRRPLFARGLWCASPVLVRSCLP